MHAFSQNMARLSATRNRRPVGAVLTGTQWSYGTPAILAACSALFLWLCCVGPVSVTAGDETGETQFRDEVAPVLARRCLACHNDTEAKGGLSFTTRERAFQGGDSGASITPGDVDSSWLLDMLSGDEPDMPKDADPLQPEQIEAIRTWIAAGAPWPEGAHIDEPQVADLDWWSLRPLEQATLPTLSAADETWVRTPVDAFVIAKLREHGLRPAPEADRRTLIRRLYFDLIGLPPSPAAVEQFVHDGDPHAYERLVDSLLQSPQYGERWARHWLDVVHYGDTHGYDKDKLRPNAWPYRDYVIRSFNDDKPYARFVREQIAGDVLWPRDPAAIEATGFIAAGPWDFIGHAEVPEEKLDGQVARNLDRDDMVSSTINTFLSTTVQCARCHNHKFDPVTQEHYYSLQAVFAALDRADRAYDADPEVARTRLQLTERRQVLEQRQDALRQLVQSQGGAALSEAETQIAEIRKQLQVTPRPEFGYHSQIEAEQNNVKWLQIDLGEPRDIAEIVLIGAHDDYNNIGAGFGFPVRYKVEASNREDFSSAVTVVADQTGEDVPNPGVAPQTLPASGLKARYVRVTATKLAPRSGDYIFALGEVEVRDTTHANMARGATVTSLDSIEAPSRWQRSNVVDGYYHGVQVDDRLQVALVELEQKRQALLEQLVDPAVRGELADIQRQLEEVQNAIAGLPSQRQVYVGTVYTGSGAFRGRGHLGGEPREIHVLHRGNVAAPGKRVAPGTLPLIEGVDWHFELPAEHDEGARRVALADWIVRADNPLTWRSLVNRVWLYHFGQGIVASPNDFGRMGEKPSHPELLDWLAVQFRDHGQSLKALHRLMVNSSTYRQAATENPEFAAIDGNNRLLWRMNRQGLEAEVIRDSVLMVSGKMDLKMYGPAFRDFVLERPEHSPHYQYHKHDPNDPTTHRRSVYRFLVRSQQQPFMQTLDCADPSQSVAKRDTTITAIQALTLLNNKFMVAMAENFADRLRQEADGLEQQIERAYALALARAPTDEERAAMTAFAEQHGLANACRVVLNLNEFMFVD